MYYIIRKVKDKVEKINFPVINAYMGNPENDKLGIINREYNRIKSLLTNDEKIDIRMVLEALAKNEKEIMFSRKSTYRLLQRLGMHGITVQFDDLMYTWRI